jgi:hypothetical protein
MDILALTFYACICGVLSAVAPRFGSTLSRIGLGIIVGALAAFILPLLRGIVSSGYA